MDDTDVIGFSYSDHYTDCSTGRLYTSRSFPDATLPGGPVPPFAATIAPLPEYGPRDTCGGVEEAAEKLDSVIQRLISLEPDATFVLIGHSLGGMVVAYYVSQQDPEFVSQRIQGLVTLDAPLGGDTRGSRSVCDRIEPSWRDISGLSGVVTAIGNISDPLVLAKFLTINSTNIGDTLPGANNLKLNCAPLGPVIGIIFGGHGCGFHDEKALKAISSVVNTGGFR